MIDKKDIPENMRLIPKPTGRPKGSKGTVCKGMSLNSRMKALTKIIKDPTTKKPDRINAIKVLTDMNNDRLKDETKEDITKVIFTFEEIVLKKDNEEAADKQDDEPKDSENINDLEDNDKNVTIRPDRPNNASAATKVLKMLKDDTGVVEETNSPSNDITTCPSSTCPTNDDIYINDEDLFNEEDAPITEPSPKSNKPTNDADNDFEDAEGLF